MLVGNNSAGGSRQVDIWDHLTVHGTLSTDGFASVGSTLTTNGDIIAKKPIKFDHNVSHPDDVDGAIYRADGQLQIAVDDLVRFRNTTNKNTTIELNTSNGNIVANGDINSNNVTTGNIRVGGVGMRTWILNHWVKNGDNIIEDPNGTRYNADNWVVGIIGWNQDSNWDHMGGRQELYTFVGGNNLWYIRGELEGPDDRAGVRIIAYPIQYFDSAWGRNRDERVNW